MWGALALCAALMLLLTPAALAQSAGNQQYVDPLASTTPTAPASTGSPPPPSSSAPPASSSAPATSSAPPTSSAPATSAPATGASSDAPAHAAGATLPFTGLDLWPAVAVGFGLIGSGLVLRRLARR